MKREFSGKLLLRIEPRLHNLLASRASKEHSSINMLCVRLISEGLLEQKKSPWWLEEGKKIVPQLRHKFGTRLIGIAVFGSQVEGRATEDSDLDILIVLDADTPLQRSLYSWWDDAIKWEGSVEVTPQFVLLPKNLEDAGGIWFEVAMASEVLWERGRKLSTMIKALRKLIESDHIRRYWSNGQPYWIRRGDEEQGSRA